MYKFRCVSSFIQITLPGGARVLSSLQYDLAVKTFHWLNSSAWDVVALKLRSSDCMS